MPAMDADRLAFLLALLEADGPTGHEQPAADVWRADAAHWATRVEADVLGSSYAHVGPDDGPAALLLGHIDEIGVIVTHVEDADSGWPGLLRIAALGSWDAQVLVGQRLRRHGAVGDDSPHDLAQLRPVVRL